MYYLTVPQQPTEPIPQPPQVPAGLPFWQLLILSLIGGGVFSTLGVKIIDHLFAIWKIKNEPKDDWDISQGDARKIFNVLNELKSRTGAIKVHIIVIENIDKVVTKPSDVLITMLDEIFEGAEGIKRYWQKRQADEGCLHIIKSLLDNGEHIQIIEDLEAVAKIRTDLEGWLFHAMVSCMINIKDNHMFMLTACYNDEIDEYAKMGAVKKYAHLLYPYFE